MNFGESVLSACFWSPGKLCIWFLSFSLNSRLSLSSCSQFFNLPFCLPSSKQLFCEALDPCTSGMRISQVALLWQMELCQVEAEACTQSHIFFPSMSAWLNLRSRRKFWDVILPQSTSLNFSPTCLSFPWPNWFPNSVPSKIFNRRLIINRICWLLLLSCSLQTIAEYC